MAAAGAVNSIDDLYHRFDLLALEGSKKREASLQQVLVGSKFRIFTVVRDLGYWGWTPTGPYKSLADATAQEILDQIDVHMIPDELIGTWAMSSIQRGLPRRFAQLAPHTHVNKYPHAAPTIVSLHVATKSRGVNLDKDIDFYFGGSTLQMLAHLTIEDGYQYLVTRVPHHPNIICVCCLIEYIQDYNQAGFQFERLMTGKQFTDPPGKSHVKHIQILKVGGHRVLFTAEVDAIKDGQSVEIKASNPFFWGTRIMFQMISNGSTIMCAGHKSRDVLKGIQQKSLSQVTQEALRSTSVSKLEYNICTGIMMLKKEATAKLREGEVLELYVAKAGVIKLRPVSGKVLFPSDAISKELLG